MLKVLQKLFEAMKAVKQTWEQLEVKASISFQAPWKRENEVFKKKGRREREIV